MGNVHRYLNIVCAAMLMLALGMPLQATEALSGPVALQQLLEETSSRYADIRTLETDFVQVRNTRLLKEPAETRGHFQFRKPDGFLWQFTSPYNIRIYLQDTKVYKLDDDRKTVASLSVRKYKDPLLKFLDISEVMDFLNKYFIIKELDTKLDDIYVIFIPKKRKVKKRIRIVEAWIDSDRLLFNRIKITEVGDTETTISFMNTRVNGEIPMDRFAFDTTGYEKEEWQE